MLNYSGMSYADMAKIYIYNKKIRENLLNLAKEQSSDVEKVKFVIDYFTNNLPKDILARIDEVSEKEVVDFAYDYSFVKGSETLYAREQKLVKYPKGYGITLPSMDRDIDVDNKPKIFPTLFSLKLGTCTMFGHEFKRLMSNLGIPCEIVETKEPVYCYDYFQGRDVENYPINVNEIKKINHCYNIVTIDGKQLKVDIAGYLTAKDYNRNHPASINNPIDPNKFYLSEGLCENPFENALLNEPNQP